MSAPTTPAQVLYPADDLSPDASPTSRRIRTPRQCRRSWRLRWGAPWELELGSTAPCEGPTLAVERPVGAAEVDPLVAEVGPSGGLTPARGQHLRWNGPLSEARDGEGPTLAVEGPTVRGPREGPSPRLARSTSTTPSVVDTSEPYRSSVPNRAATDTSTASTRDTKLGRETRASVTKSGSGHETPQLTGDL